MQSDARSVEDYLASLDVGRREALTAIRGAILESLPDGYEERMQYGMISYSVPLTRYPDTYNGQPLAMASVASQKNYISVYLTGIYCNPDEEHWFTEEYRKTGKRLNMGKSCVRFRKLDDVPLDLIGRAVARLDVDRFIEVHETARAGARRAREESTS
jgi:hypothetical protein